jgi:DNA-binding response OmpR family regulator
VRELRPAYIAGLAAPIELLSAALEADGPYAEDRDETIRRVAHQLKGAGGSFGFPEITESAAKVLEATRRDFEPAARALLAMLQQTAEGPDASISRGMIIDDDPTIRLLLEVALEGQFDQLDAVESLAEARSSIRNPRPALVLLDLVLPDGDGRAFLAELRSQPEFAPVKIAVMSAHGRREVKEECLRLGADRYIQKPFSPDAVIAQVAEVLRSPARPPPQEVDRLVKADTPGASGANRGRRVLIAEDDPLTADLVVDRLRRRGFDVLCYSDGQTALEAARHRDLAVAIIDVHMPRMNGLELLTRLRGMRRHANTPVLVLTGMADEQTVVRAFELGADDYVLKPFSPSELTARVAHLVAA